MMNKRYSISVILPVYNEEENIAKILGEVVNFLQSREEFTDYEIIVVNDGSKDQTADIIRKFANNHRLRVITHIRNMGYGRTLMSGIENSRCSLVFLMDADGQFNICELVKLMFYIDQYDMVAGYRKSRQDLIYRVILGKTYTFVFCSLFGLRMKDINCGFKLFKRRILDGFELKHNGAITTGEILLRINHNCKIKEIPVTHFPRLKGKQSGASLKVISGALIDLCLLLWELKLSRINLLKVIAKRFF